MSMKEQMTLYLDSEKHHARISLSGRRNGFDKLKGSYNWIRTDAATTVREALIDCVGANSNTISVSFLFGFTPYFL